MQNHWTSQDLSQEGVTIIQLYFCNLVVMRTDKYYRALSVKLSYKMCCGETTAGFTKKEKKTAECLDKSRPLLERCDYHSAFRKVGTKKLKIDAPIDSVSTQVIQALSLPSCGGHNYPASHIRLRNSNQLLTILVTTIIEYRHNKKKAAQTSHCYNVIIKFVSTSIQHMSN